MLLANAVVEILPRRPFLIHISNWSNTPKRLCKNTVVGYAQVRPSVLLVPTQGVEEPSEPALEQPACNAEASNADAEDAKSWQSEMDLDHIRDNAMRHSIL